MKKLLLFLLLIGGLLAGATYWFTHRRDDSAEIAYTTTRTEFGSLVEIVNATAVVQPRQLYIIGTEASGKVVEIAADVNQEVKEGDVLLRLDDRVARKKREQAAAAIEAARKAVKQAEAVRDAARTALRRERDLNPRVRSQTKIQQLESQLKTAEAAISVAQSRVKQAEEELALAELALQFAVVRAPILKPGDGTSLPQGQGSPAIGALSHELPKQRERRTFVVLARKVSLGQQIGPPLSAHLFTLAGDLSQVSVEAQVAEGDLGKIRKGLTATFTVSAYEDLEFHGEVAQIHPLPVTDRGAVFYRVVLEAQNQRDPRTGRWRLTPGLTANVDIRCREHSRTWKMPAMALSFQPEDVLLSERAREKLRRWQTVQDRDHWRPVWVVGKDNRPWPLFVRVGGKGPDGEMGIRDLSYTEVLEWDPELAKKPDPADPATYPEVIIAAPPPRKGLFNTPSIKF